MDQPYILCQRVQRILTKKNKFFPLTFDETTGALPITQIVDWLPFF